MRSLLTALQSFRSRPAAERTRLLGLLVEEAKARGLRSALQRVRDGGVSAIRPGDYLRWCERYTPGPAELVQMRATAARFEYRPLITIVTPVYNTDQQWIEACADAVLAQAYPHWQWSIGNDGSTDPGTRAALDRIAARDARIIVSDAPSNRGISAATNLALSRADGEYVALMDSDDALLPHALFRIAEQLNRHAIPADVIYSDEDKLELDGTRCDPYFKPEWSPELFLSNMYVCHLLVARRDLVREVGGFRTAFDFSQDYDLMLRLMERARRIDHVSDILYHWRKVPQSGAAVADAKPTAHLAGRQALQDYLDRNRLSGKIADAGAPGFYRPRLHVTDEPLVSVVGAASDTGLAAAAARAGARVESVSAAERAVGTFLLFGVDGLHGADDEWLLALLEAAQFPGVAAVAPLVLDEAGRIRGAGVALGGPHGAGVPLAGTRPESGGYFGSTLVLRNVAAAGLAGLLVRRDAYVAAGGLDATLDGDTARAIDLCLRLRSQAGRLVHTPWARLVDPRPGSAGVRLAPADLERLRTRWPADFARDPFHSPHRMDGLGGSAA